MISSKNSNYSEQALVEKPAMDLFSQLGWDVANCFNEFDERGVSFLGRDNKSDVVLLSRLKPILQKINHGIPEQVCDEAIKILTQDRSLMGLVSANREVYELLKNGILVSYLNNKNEQVRERVKIIDWNNIDNNDFFLASQFWISGEMYTRRADLIGFVNGIPLLFIELKASHRNLKQAYDENLRDYKSTIPQVFWFNGVIILSKWQQKSSRNNLIRLGPLQ